MQSRKISVLGGGHGARTIAADMTLAGHEVMLFEFESFHDNIGEIFDTHKITISGKTRQGTAELHCVTHDMGQALASAELVLIVVPALAHRIYAQAMAEHLRDGHNILLIPGTFGCLEFVHTIRQANCTAETTIAELDTLPYATRIQTPTSVNVYHYLSTFGMGVFPAVRTEAFLGLVKGLYPGVFAYRDVLESGLSNCNPVIHPLGVLLNAGRIEYSRGEFWYYEEGITPSTAKAMEALDQERIAIGKKLGLDLPTQAQALHEVGYGPEGDLWQVLKASKGLTPIKGPTSLSNRYVTEDVPIGLVCWSQLGDLLGVPNPLIKATIEIAQAIASVDYWQTGRTLQRCGIDGKTAEQLCGYAQNGSFS